MRDDWRVETRQLERILSPSIELYLKVHLSSNCNRSENGLRLASGMNSCHGSEHIHWRNASRRLPSAGTRYSTSCLFIFFPHHIQLVPNERIGTDRMKYDIRHRNELRHPLYGTKKIHILPRTKSYLGDPKPLFAHYTSELRMGFTKLQVSQTKTYDEVSNQRLPLTPTAT